MNLGFDAANSVRGFHFKREKLFQSGFDEHSHADATKGQWTPFGCSSQKEFVHFQAVCLLVWYDALLVVNLGFGFLNCVRILHRLFFQVVSPRSASYTNITVDG